MKDKELRGLVATQSLNISRMSIDYILLGQKVKRLTERIKLLENELKLELVNELSDPKYIKKDAG